MNRSAYIKRQLLSEVMKYSFSGELKEQVDRIPVSLFPKKLSSYRCCIYKDRAMVRQRILAVLGFSHEQDDEIQPLSHFAGLALERKKVPGDSLTLMPELCSGCDGGKYKVSDLCRRCVARSCSQACPRNAVSFEGDRARIDQESCIKCGKCAQACAYHAVSYQPVPCEENCPVDAIARDEAGVRYIDKDKCIHCGRCVTGCPFGAPLDVSHAVDVVQGLLRGRKMAALLAPAVLAQFPGDPARLRGALLEAGFAAVYDVGQGAAQVAGMEACEGMERIEQGEEGALFSSCCPAWVLAQKKYLPNLEKQLSHTPSPMALTAARLKELEPELQTVFIGPCFAKKEEARSLETVDAVLSFEELGALLMARNIQLEDCPAVGYSPLPGWEAAQTLHWSFAKSGGLSENLLSVAGQDARVETVAGLDRKQMKKLSMADRFYSKKDFVEVMACMEGCIGGPGCLVPPEKAIKNFGFK